MTVPPGYGCDLEAQVDAALVSNTPNVPVDSFSEWDTSLLAAVFIDGLYDLADRLLTAGAQMDVDDFRAVLYWGCSAAEAIYLLERCVPRDKDSLNKYLKPILHRETWEPLFVILDYGADIEITFEFGARLLHLAAKEGKSYAVKQLLERSAIVDSRDEEGFTPLMKACDWRSTSHRARASTVHWLLTHGADPNAQTPTGEAPLLLCTGHKLNWTNARTQTAQMLLRFGANPNVISPRGTTPLMFAARDNDEILTYALPKAGAEKATKTPDGRTARDVAEQYAHEALLGNEAIVALLS